MTNENAKNKDWNIPMKLPSVRPEDYPKDVDATHGSAAKDGGKHTAKKKPE